VSVTWARSFNANISDFREPRPVENHVRQPQTAKSLTRSWTGITAEVVELQGAGRHLADLRSEKPRLTAILEDVGGFSEMRSAPDRPARSARGLPNHLSFVSPGTPVWEYAEKVCFIRRIVIDFDVPVLAANFADAREFQFRFPPRLMFANTRVWTLADLLADECANAGASDQTYGESLALAIFYNLFRLGEADQQERRPMQLTPKQLRRVIEHIEQCSSDNVQLKDLAEMTGLSQSYFSRAFKASTGLPPHRWHLTTRIRRAQQVLLETDDPLVEVALASGFSDQSHFTRVFSKIAGESPGAWRRKHTA